MDNIILCPICNGKENGCDYCHKVGYVIKDSGAYYSIILDSNDQPQKDIALGQPKTQDLNSTKSTSSSLFLKPEPHDIKWFFKDKLK